MKSGLGDLARFMSLEMAPLSEPATLVALSPSTYVDRIRAPLFLYAGARDVRTPVNQLDGLVRTLRAKKQRVEYMLVDQGHARGDPRTNAEMTAVVPPTRRSGERLAERGGVPCAGSEWRICRSRACRPPSRGSRAALDPSSAAAYFQLVGFLQVETPTRRRRAQQDHVGPDRGQHGRLLVVPHLPRAPGSRHGQAAGTFAAPRRELGDVQPPAQNARTSSLA